MKKTETKAVDSTVVLSDGTESRLGEFWRENPVVLVFLRHFG